MLGVGSCFTFSRWIGFRHELKTIIGIFVLPSKHAIVASKDGGRSVQEASDLLTP